MPTETWSYNDIRSHLTPVDEVPTMCMGSHAKTEAKMNTGQVQNFSTFHIHLPSAFSAAAIIIAAIAPPLLGVLPLPAIPDKTSLSPATSIAHALRGSYQPSPSYQPPNSRTGPCSSTNAALSSACPGPLFSSKI